jgi:tetratricopeptide (TPR) repeat protein
MDREVDDGLLSKIVNAILEDHVDNCSDEIEKLLARNIDNNEILLLYAKHLFAKGKNIEAVNYLGEIINNNENFIPAYVLRGNILYRMDKINSALIDLQKASVYYADTETIIGISYSDLMPSRFYFNSIYWDVLSEVGLHDVAYTVSSREAMIDNRDYWERKMIFSLVNLNKTREAEVVFGCNLDSYLRSSWIIADYLLSIGKYEMASFYYSRCLSQCYPLKSFMYYQPYIESLICQSNFCESMLICNYIIQENSTNDTINVIYALLAIVYVEMERYSDALTMINHIDDIQFSTNDFATSVMYQKFNAIRSKLE